MTGPAALVTAAVIGYLLGAIPSGYFVVRLLTKQDVREQGSGRTGATNVRRVLGWKGFFLVLFLDALKSAVAVTAAGLIASDVPHWSRAVAGIAAVVGHSWPVYMRFRGGRGVAPGIGALLVMLPLALVVAALLAVPLVLLSRYVSLGSLVGAATAAVAALIVVLTFHQPWPYFLFTLAAATLVVVKHSDNIARLLSGTERRI